MELRSASRSPNLPPFFQMPQVAHQVGEQTSHFLLYSERDSGFFSRNFKDVTHTNILLFTIFIYYLCPRFMRFFFGTDCLT
ncbi:protein of unknown function [Rhodovastum atsumiense]|nr:protein of unknown function [Rhodovastum atsumiense]